MEQWMKKLSGVMIASALALTLSTKASADGDPPPETTVIEDNAGAADGSGTAGGTDPTRDVDVPGDAPADPTGGNVGPYIQIDNNVSSDPPVVIDPDAEDNIDKTDDEDGTGFWGYEAGEADSQSDNIVYMVDNSLQSITAYETDLYIEAGELVAFIVIGPGGPVALCGDYESASLLNTGKVILACVFCGVLLFGAAAEKHGKDQQKSGKREERSAFHRILLIFFISVYNV